MDKNIYNPLGEISFYIKKYEPAYIIGPTIEESFVLYYVINGKGKYTVLGKIYQLEKGHIFIIQPNYIFSLIADEANPWELAAIDFDGNLLIHYLSIIDLSSENPIRLYNLDDYLENLCVEMLQTKELPEYLCNIKLMGLILLFFSRIMEFNTINNIVPRTKEEFYICQTIKYIHDNYKSKFTVNEISKFLGLDRSYFSKLFKNHLGIPPQQYIVQFKVDRACEMLANTSLGLGYIANSLGYSDYFAFSKTFKKIKGISPVPYRKLFKQINDNIDSNIIRSDKT